MNTHVRSRTYIRSLIGLVSMSVAFSGGVIASASNSPESSGEASGSPIRIGLAMADTGRSASAYAPSDEVALAWAEWVNSEHGGINGHPVEIVIGDTKSDAAEAVTVGRELVERDEVIAMIIQDTTSENALAEYLVTQGVAYVGGASSGRTAEWPNTYFTMATTNPALAAAGIIAGKAAGYEAIAAAVCAEVPACAEAGQLYESLTPAYDVGFAGFVTVGAADPSYTAPCLELINQGADFVYLGLTSATAVSLIDECLAQGYEGAFGATTTSVSTAAYEVIDGLVLGGALHGFPWWADDPKVEEFRDVVEAASDVDYRTPAATNVWASLELFRKALTEYGPAVDAEVTSADVVDAYYQISDETLDGLLPQPLTFTEGDGAQPSVDCFWLFVMEDGELSSLQSGESGNGVSGDLQSSCADV